MPAGTAMSSTAALARAPALRAFILAALSAVALHAGARAPVQLWNEADLRLRPGVRAQVVVRISVAEGHALVGAGVRHQTLRPLQLRMQPAEGIRFGPPAYPPAQPATLPGSAAPVPVHTGVVAIRLPVEVARDASWRSTTLRGVLRYQACGDGTCQAPATLPVAMEVEKAPEPDAR